MARYDPDRHKRRSIRLRNYDYSRSGAYFITTCTANRELLLADSVLSSAVEGAWKWLPTRFSMVELDAIVIMPDHVHFIVVLDGQDGQMAVPTLPQVVGTFKTVAAKAINRARNAVGQPVWQRNYYERIVRNERELARIRAYIANNPTMSHAHERDDIPNAWL